MGGRRLGAFEELVLLAVPRLEEAYAVSVQRCLAETAGHEASMGAVYTALERLQEKGFLESRLGSTTPRRGGRRKRFYRITEQGILALQQARAARERLWKGLRFHPSGMWS